MGNDRTAASWMPRQIASKWRGGWYRSAAWFDDGGGRMMVTSPVVVAIKALACELPSAMVFWSRGSGAASGGGGCGIVARSADTIGAAGQAHAGAIVAGRPATAFAGRLAASRSDRRRWKGAARGRAIMCSASMRRPPSRRGGETSVLTPRPRALIDVEHEYVRAGALADLAAWDVHRARLFGRCERKNSIAAFHRLVRQVMGREPIGQPPRVLIAEMVLPPWSTRC